ncbi:MAG: hypothetical protein R2762_21620 [Bryobacteraceae bacterium]
MDAARKVGNRLTPNLPMTFSGGLAGQRIIDAAARDSVSKSSGWQAAGAITLP